MAFSLSTFTPVGGQSSRGSAPQIFSYSSSDTKATIQTDGYFNTARTVLEVNDIIAVIASDGYIQIRVTLVPLNGDITVISTAGEFSSATIDNILIDGNTISTTDTDGDLILNPNGSGALDVQASISVTGTVDGRDLATDGAKLDLLDQGLATTDSPTFASLTVDNIDIDGNSITVTDTDGNLTLVPNGTGHVDIYDPPSTEESGININGTTYDSGFRINDIGGTAPAQVIIHKHSLTLPPALIGARTNSDTDSHTAVTAGQSTLSLYGAGWTGSHYDLTGQIDFSVDTSGTISGTSSPGRIRLMTTPDGSNVPVTALTIDSNQSVIISDVEINNAFISSVDGSGQNFQIASDTGFIDMLDDVNMAAGKTIEGRDIAADGTKLDNIEANADVTNTANVTAAGALMDSELTNITAVKALDQGVATTDSPTFNIPSCTGLTIVSNGINITAGDIDITSGDINLTSGFIILSNGNIELHNANNDANPQVRIGSSDAEELHIQSVYDTGAQTLDYVLFQTDVASATADKGLFRFNVDGTDILDIDDGGLELTGSITVSGTVDGRDIATDGSNLDNLYTTIGLSALTSAEVDQLENIGSTTISSAQWGYLGASDQGIATTDSPTFDSLTLSGDIINYDAVNNGNPQIRLGSSDAEELRIQSVYDSGAQTLNYVLFQTDAASATADKGLFRFNVDGTNILDIEDGGLDVTGKTTSSTSVVAGNLSTTYAQLSSIGSIELAGTVPFIDFKNGAAEDYDCRIAYDSNGFKFNVGGNGTISEAFHLKSTTSIVCGSGALGTAATNGFFYIRSCGGTPTGTPTSYSGRVPMVFDTTNNKLYIYDGSWIAIN